MVYHVKHPEEVHTGGPRDARGWVLSVVYHSPCPLLLIGEWAAKNPRKGSEKNAHSNGLTGPAKTGGAGGGHGLPLFLPRKIYCLDSLTY